MLIVVSSLLGSIMAMGMDSAQSMFFFKYKSQGLKVQAHIVTAILQWRLLWGILIVLIATVLSPVFSVSLFQGQLRIEHFVFAFVSVLFSQITGQSAEIAFTL